MIPEALLRALEIIYAGRYGGEWEVVRRKEQDKNE